MPIVGYSQKDILRGKLITPGWYVIHIEGVGEQASKDGGSTNYPVEGTIVKSADTGSEDFAGVPVDWNFNSKAIGFSIGFLEALGVQVAAGQRYDLAHTAGKDIIAYIANEEY